MNKFLKTAVLLLATVLVACGGGGGGGGGGGSVSGTNTSQFVDSPVQGLYFVASPSGETGSTNSEGDFTFKDGDTVTFKIGGKDGLEIASTTPDKDTQIFVADLPGGKKVAQILQSLDLGGDARTKLDLSQITSLPMATIQALKAHIKDGTLTAGVSLLTTHQILIKANIPALASKTFPAAKTEAEVDAHLQESLSKAPKVIPALNNKVFIFVGNSNAPNKQDFNLIGFKDGKITHLGNDLGVATGTYTKSGANLVMTYNTLKDFSESGPSITRNIDCTIRSAFSKFDPKIAGAFEVTSTFSGTACSDTADETDEFVAIDTDIRLANLAGNQFKLEAHPDLGADFDCGPVTWTFGAGVDNLSLTSSTTSTNFCTGVKFGGNSGVNAASVEVLGGDAPFVFVADVDYGYGMKGKYHFVKIAALVDSYVLLWASNFVPPDSQPTNPPAIVDWKIRKAVPMKFVKQ